MIQTQQLDLYKEILGSYPSGVTIITTTDNNNNPVGLTVNSFVSVSLEPLIVSWCIDRGSDSLEAFKNSTNFAVNILSGDQKEGCMVFASRKEKDRFSKVEWELSKNQLPIINGAFSTLECEKIEQIEVGDHTMLIGEVIDLQKNNTDPMLYYRRNMGFAPDKF